MKFSIIVPVYNVEKYISKCLDSILQQDNDDYEIIAVNDGSTDGSKEVLDLYSEKTQKLYVINQENKGLGGARNTGIKKAKGEYLLFLDSDDYIEQNTLSELGKYLTKEKLDILAFDCKRVDEAGKLLEIVSVNRYKNLYTKLTSKQFVIFEPTACTKVYKRTLFIDNEIWFPERLWYEDLATILKLAIYSPNIGYLKRPFYNYVQQPNSITHSVNISRMMEIKKAFNSEIEFYKSKNLFEEYYEELEWNCILHVLYYSAYRLLICGYHKKEMKELFEYCETLFPNWEKNAYLLAEKKNRNLMDLIVNKKYFGFYLKTGFQIKCVEWLKTILPHKS